MTAAVVGDTNFLANYIINTKLYAVVMPPDSTAAPEFVATFEVQGDQGTLTMAAIIGPRGPAGIDMFALALQTDGLEDPGELPQTLTNTVADKGKFWIFDDVNAEGNIIGSSGYIWYGDTYKRIQMGTPGPPGPIPIITPDVELVPVAQGSEVVPGGTPAYPTMLFQLAVPPGPQGPGAALALAPDVDFVTNIPTPGDVLGFTGRYTASQTLAPPTNLTAGAVTSGGTLPAGPHYYMVTAIDSAGETTASNEATVTTTGSTSVVHLTWTATIGGAGATPTGYRIYRGNETGLENILVGTVGPTTEAFTDTGASTTSGTPPATNTTSIKYPIWVPVSISQLIPSPYSMPENSFSSFSGLSQRAQIGSFALPPQPFPWTPVCWGHIGAFGLELSANPLMIGCEVRLGDPTAGALISRGFGNTLGEVNIMPHYSNPSNTSTAITPSNGVAAVPANHTNPAQGTIYVNLYNDGQLGVYQFSPTDAQVFCMIIPVSPTSMRAATFIETERRRPRKVKSERV